MISICLPTRGRPLLFKTLCQSVLETATNPDDIEFISYHDDDDNTVYEYVGNHKEVVGARIIQSQMFNECLKVATGPIFMFASDDVVFYTDGWDDLVKDAFEQAEDKIMYVHGNDQNPRFGSRFGLVGFLHKNWVDTLGYLLPPYFAAECADNWINECAIELGRKYYLKDMIIKHHHAENDSTNVEYKTRTRNAHAIYRLKTDERMGDVQKLRDFMINFRKK